MNKLTTVPFFCSKDCPDACSFHINEDQKVASFSGDGSFRGNSMLENAYRSLCHKLSGFIETEGKRTAIQIENSKDGLIRLADYLREGKPILYYRGSGSISAGMASWDYLLSHFSNVWFTYGTPCQETGVSAHEKDFTVSENPSIENIEKADRIILWGKNAKATSPHLYRYLKRLKEKKKVSILCIDPIYNDSCDIADDYIAIRPAGDGFLAWVASEIILNSNFSWNDIHEIKQNRYFQSEDVMKLIHYLQPEKTAIITGSGLQRYENGENSVRLINRLAVISGNQDRLYYFRSSKGRLSVNQSIQKKLETVRRINIDQIPSALEEHKFDGMLVVASNPVATMPRSGIWKRMLRNLNSFVVDPVETDTSDFARNHIRVDGMRFQEDAGGSYFFPERHLFRELDFQKGSIQEPVFNDIDAVRYLAKELNIDISRFLDKMKNLKTDSLSEPCRRKEYQYPEIEPCHPIISEQYPLRVVSNSSIFWLNSQLAEYRANAKRKNYLYISSATAQEKDLHDEDAVHIFNENGSIKAFVIVDRRLMPGIVYTFKGKKLIDAYINELIPSKGTDAGNGLALYDTWVDIKKDLN